MPKSSHTTSYSVCHTVVGPLVVPEAQFGSYAVTPHLAWDNGEVSGPSDNWSHVPLTTEHLLLAICALSGAQRAVLFMALNVERT